MFCPKFISLSWYGTIKSSRTYSAHHLSRIVSRQVSMVCVNVCGGQELQEAIKKLEQEALQRARR